jgi:phosphoribulokinase
MIIVGESVKLFSQTSQSYTQTLEISGIRKGVRFNSDTNKYMLFNDESVIYNQSSNTYTTYGNPLTEVVDARAIPGFSGRFVCERWWDDYEVSLFYNSGK